MKETSFISELKIWSIYFLTIFLAIYIHEIGHCIPAWIEGVRAIPTPAKEYILDEISQNLQQRISLAGIIGTILFTIVIYVFYLIKSVKYSSAILAGAIAMPAAYTLRFLLAGRGHDATEFQEAQSAIGLSYSGHSLDWIFLSLTIIGILVWIVKSKPNIKIIGRLLIGVILTLIFVIGLQVFNNAIFDPIFQA